MPKRNLRKRHRNGNAKVEKKVTSPTTPSSKRKMTSKAKSPKLSAAQKKIACSHGTVGLDKSMQIDEKMIKIALKHLSEKDERLGKIIKKAGAPESLVDRVGMDSFKSLCRSIIYQQLSTKSAGKMYERFEKVCGGNDKLLPNVVMKLNLENDTEKRLSIGLSRPKVKYLLDLSSKFESGELSHERLSEMTDIEAMEALCSVKGIGEWSAHMFLMFSLGRPDVLPVGDLGIRKGFQSLYDLKPKKKGGKLSDSLPDRTKMIEISDSWRPYRTIGSWYMWRVAAIFAKSGGGL
mmetsp:Transcript_21991/g.32775  ORF Transcript_21991/g.32775 Transcript_21991/m.32775 type:complete len:292 (+) Transcript_21991:110-985(+)